MEKYFKKVSGEYVNVITHTVNLLKQYPNLTIRISTDSQTMGAVTRYATVIVYRYSTNGAHYVVFKEDVKREKVDYMRLYNEGLRTLDTSEMLRTNIPSINIEALEFDYADVNKTLSSTLVGVFKGYLNAIFKSGDMYASKAADHECRRGSNMFNLLDLKMEELAA